MKNQVRFFIGFILMLFLCLPCVESSAQNLNEMLVQILSNTEDDNQNYQQKIKQVDELKRAVKDKLKNKKLTSQDKVQLESLLTVLDARRQQLEEARNDYEGPTVSQPSAQTPINPDLVYSKEEADACHPASHPVTMLFAEKVENPDGYIDNKTHPNPSFGGMPFDECLRVENIIIDMDDKTSNDFLCRKLPNLKEVWFGHNSSPEFILTAFANNHFALVTNPTSSKAAMTHDCTIYLPKDKYPKGLISIQEMNRSNPFWRKGIPNLLLRFRTKMYEGDVYQAFINGGSDCKSYCPGHSFTAKVTAAHTVMQYNSCQHEPRFYYSCIYCGECEYNPKHTFTDANVSDRIGAHLHAYEAYDLSEKNFVGINYRGERVYMRSCIWCGINEKEAQLKTTQKELDKLYGPGFPLEYFQQQMIKAYDGSYKEDALAEVTTASLRNPRYFAVKDDDHGATTSDWAVNETRWAMEHGLIDKQVLGSNYCQTITREQMASLAVRLAEVLTQKTIKPASSSTYSDTKNEYALKACTANIIKGENKIFAPQEAITRQEMATYLFRALQWVVKNSNIRYTIYTPDLSVYTDNGDIAQWAREAMEFMHTLGLIKNPSKTTLKPLETCSIEEAVAVAQRCYRADELGWYQAIHQRERGYAGSEGGWSNKFFSAYPEGGGNVSYVDYENGDRIWVHDYGLNYANRRSDGISATLPLIDKYSGEVIYVSGQDFLPIKDNYQEAPASYAYIYRNDSQYYTPTSQRMADNQTNAPTTNQNDFYGTLNGHNWVDLGLPSGTKWATCNVGAKEPHHPGNHYAWGEIEPKKVYDESNSKTHGKDIPEISGNPEYDVATAKWGNGWRMPTKEQLEELLKYCDSHYIELEGRIGRMLTSKINHQSIFLPAAGNIEGTTHHNPKTCGLYITSTQAEDHYFYEHAWGWGYNVIQHTDMGTPAKCYGYSVRPVTK